MPDSVSDPADALRDSIPLSLRIKILKPRVCRYCGTCWASVVDHVIPVKQGGRSTAANLAPACTRCNAQKSAKTPAQWKRWRLDRGLSWPPLNCGQAVIYMALFLSEEERGVVRDALVAEYPPLRAAMTAFLDDVYAESDDGPTLSDYAAQMLELARQWVAAVDV